MSDFWENETQTKADFTHSKEQNRYTTDTRNTHSSLILKPSPYHEKKA